MNSTFVSILQQLVSEQGKEALLKPARCKAFLADYTKGEYKKESRLLLQALETGVPKAIITTVELDICKQQQVSVLREEHFLAVEMAADVVDTLVLVLRGEKESGTSLACSNCGKELQKEWRLCPYCSTPVAKIQQSPPQPMPSSEPVVEAPSPAPAVPPSSPAPVTQTVSPLPTVPPKKKNTVRNVVLAVLVVLVGGIIIYNLNSGPSYSGPTTAPSSSAPSLQNAKAFFDKGVSYFDNIKYDDAITQFSEAIRLDPNYAEAYAMRGIVYARSYNHDMAIKDFDEAIRLNPKYDYAYARRGAAYTLKSQWDKSMRKLDNITRDLDNAVRDLDEAIRLNPNYDYYAYRGDAYRSKGQYDTAIRDLDEAIKQKPNFEWAYRVRALVYNELGQKNEAIKDLEKVLSIAPNDDWAKGWLQEIRGY